MSEPILLSHDDYTGVTEYFHVLEDGVSWAVESRQDISGIIEVNKALQNDAPARWGDLTHVASIPLVVLAELQRQGIVQMDGHVQDQERFRTWLNSPDNKFFRTKLGKV